MKGKYSMKLSTLVDSHKLGILYQSTDYENVEIWNYNISRPSLQFVDFYDYFDRERIQITGKAEAAYLRTLLPTERERVIDTLFAQKIPACYFRIGIHEPGTPFSNLHRPNLIVDERSLELANGLVAYNAIMALKNKVKAK